jgi:hypothetical protein
MNPRVRMRLTHPKELALHLLNRMLFQVGQHEEAFVRDRGQWTGAIGTIATARAGVPINRAVLPVGHKRLLDMRQQGHTFRFRQASHRS